jgi:hypothetical protein
MMRPSPQESHVDGPLSDISIAYHNDAFVGKDIFPVVKVKKQSDVYYKMGKEHMKRIKTDRSPGTRSRSVYHTLSTAQYFCSCHALNEPVADEERDNADTPISPEIDATENVTSLIELDQEIRIYDLLVDGITNTAGPTSAWGTTNSTFDKDIITAIKYIHSKVFLKPNLMIIPYEVACTLTFDPTIKDMVKYIQNLLTIDSEIILPKKLYGVTIKIAGAGQNTANLGQSETLAYIWGQDVWLGYVEPSPGLKKLSLGYTFQWKERQVRKIRQDFELATYVDVMEYTDEKIVEGNCGFRITSVLG